VWVFIVLGICFLVFIDVSSLVAGFSYYVRARLMVVLVHIILTTIVYKKYGAIGVFFLKIYCLLFFGEKK